MLEAAWKINILYSIIFMNTSMYHKCIQCSIPSMTYNKYTPYKIPKRIFGGQIKHGFFQHFNSFLQRITSVSFNVLNPLGCYTQVLLH